MNPYRGISSRPHQRCRRCGTYVAEFFIPWVSGGTENFPWWNGPEICEHCTRECGYMGPHTFYRVFRYRYDVSDTGRRMNERYEEVDYPRPVALDFERPTLFSRLREYFSIFKMGSAAE